MEQLNQVKAPVVVNSEIVATNQELLTKYGVIFLADVQACNHLTENTFKTYQWDLKIFAKFVNNNCNINLLNVEMLKAFSNYLDSKLKAGEYKLATVNRYFRTVKDFYNWLYSKGLITGDISRIKAFKSETKYHKKVSVPAIKVKQILTNNSNDLTELRDRAIIALGSICGLRRVEIHRANVGDLSLIDNKTVLYVQGKGHSSKDDYVIVPEQVKALINKYLDKLSKKLTITEALPLFVSLSNNKFGERINIGSISKIGKSSLRAVGIDNSKITFHSFRHYTATELLKNGVTLIKVMKTLRHKKIDTTMIYVDEINRAELNTTETLAEDIFF